MFTSNLRRFAEPFIYLFIESGKNLKSRRRRGSDDDGSCRIPEF